MNDVASVNVAETWLKSYIASEFVGLAGFFCKNEEPGGERTWRSSVLCGRDRGV